MNKTHFYIFVFVLLTQSFIGRANIYQAETAVLYNAKTETEHSGYTGDSYVNFDNESGSYLELRIGMATAAEQTIKIRFANGSSNERPMQLYLNGNDTGKTLEFPSTGEWNNWDTLSVNIDLSKGIHLLKLVSSGSEGGPNIDHLDISGEQLPYFNLSVSTNGNGSVIQKPAEGLLFSGQEIILVARPGFSASFVQWQGDYTSTNDTLRFTIQDNHSIEAVFETITLEIPEPDFEMIGYASVAGSGLSTTTGGEGGNQVVIENLQQLINWGASREDNSTPETVIIKGKIEAENTEVITIKRGANISILGYSGTGEDFGELKNVSINIRDYSNVVIRNLKMHEVFYPNDDLTIDNCHHVWIDHCEFYSKIGDGIGVDTYDGLLDIKKGSHNITVSWCYFHDHMKTVLVGHSDNNGDQDKDLQITFHHNWFSNTDGRNPSLRFGQIHYFNNYLENISDYGFAVRNGAHALIENCHFESVKLPIASDKFTGHGFACVSNCIYSGSCTNSDNEITAPYECSFWDENIPYLYSLEDVQTVSLSVQQYAGVGKTDITTSNSIFSKNDNLLIKSYSTLPEKQKIQIILYSGKSQKINFSLYSINGQKVVTHTVNALTGNQEITFTVKKEFSGIYILQLSTSTNKIARKIIL